MQTRMWLKIFLDFSEHRANAALNDKVQLIDFFVYLGDIFEYSGG